ARSLTQSSNQPKWKSARSSSGPRRWISKEANYARFLLVTLASITGDFRHDLCRRNAMKILFISFVVGLGVGVLYGLIRLKSPAPPIVALLGLLGMVLGEQFGTWVHTKNVNASQAASTCLVGQRYDRPLPIQAPDSEIQMASARGK